MIVHGPDMASVHEVGTSDGVDILATSMGRAPGGFGRSTRARWEMSCAALTGELCGQGWSA